MSRSRLLMGIGLVAVGAGILGVSAWAFLGSRSDSSAKADPTPDLTFVLAVRASLAEQVDGVATTLESPSDFGLWWIDRDEHSIINDAVPATELRAAICESDDLQQSQLRALIQRVTPGIDQVMHQQGFTRNLRNSSRNFFDDRLYDYVRAYERGEVKAVLSVSPDCWSRTGDGAMYYSLTFAYSSEVRQHAALQVPFLRDLRLGSDVVIHVSKRQGPWAVIDVNYRRTGHFIIAKRISGAWMQVFAGQDAPPCSLVNTWQIPTSITTCYDDSAA